MRSAHASHRPTSTPSRASLSAATHRPTSPCLASPASIDRLYRGGTKTPFYRAFDYRAASDPPNLSQPSFSHSSISGFSSSSAFSSASKGFLSSSPQRPVDSHASTLASSRWRVRELPHVSKYKEDRHRAVGLHWGGTSDSGQAHMRRLGQLPRRNLSFHFLDTSGPSEVPKTADRSASPAWVERLAAQRPGDRAVAPPLGWRPTSPPPPPSKYDVLMYR